MLGQLVKKNILTLVTEKQSIDYDTNQTEKEVIKLNGEQEAALNDIKQQFEKTPVVLLHGVTSSGKTEVYINLIESIAKEGKQILYLLPEIALTTQMIGRLKKHFGNQLLVYHSKFNETERATVWNRVLTFSENIEAENSR